MTTTPTSEPPSRPENHPNYHYLRLARANTVLTEASQETYASLISTLNANAIMCVHGGVGLGKTFAVNSHLDELAPHNTLRLKLSSSSLEEIRTALHQRLALPGDPPGKAARSKAMIKAALSEGPHVLVLDEAQWLDTRAFEFFRELWDDEDTNLTVVLVGAESCYQKIKNRPALESRIFAWQRYKPLTPTEVLTSIPCYHPIWAEVPTDDFLWIDDLACHGNFRRWAKITYHLQEAMTSPPYPAYSRDLVRAVLSRLDPTIRNTD